MHVEINLIKKDEDNISPCDFDLPHRESFINILRFSLQENPLLVSIKDRINMEDLRSINIKINVITEGSSFFLPKHTDYAGIDFIDYFNNKNNPVILQLHYGAYLGLRPLPLRKLFCGVGKPGNNSQIREELSVSGLDTRGIQRVLFHEFGHLIDALDPEFVYSNETYKMIEQEESQHFIFESLWNCYLDRRLQNILRWKFLYSYRRPYLQEEKELLRAIWNTTKRYNFKELADHPLQIMQKKSKAGC